MHKRNVVIRFALLAVALVQGCDPVPVSTRVDVADRPTTEPPAIVRLRRRQLLRYDVTPTSGPSTRVELQFTPSKLPVPGFRPLPDHTYDNDAFEPVLDAIDKACHYTGTVDGVDQFSSCSATSSGNCSTTACFLESQVCVVNQLLELASANSPVEIPTWDESTNEPSGHLVFPVQSRETRAALREKAVALATGTASFFAFWGSSSMFVGPSAIANCRAAVSPDSEATNADRLFVGVRELYELSRESSQAAVNDYLAIADSLRSERTASEDGVSDSRAVRLLASSILNGASPWLLPIEDYEGCPGSALTPDDQRALEVLRRTGPKPAWLRDPAITIDGLLLGSASRPGISQRYFVQEGIAVSAVAGDRVARMLRRLGLTHANFAAAREYLVAEHRAYMRSEVATDPSTTISIPSLTADEAVYLATSTTPHVPSWASFSAITRRPGISFDAYGALADAGAFDEDSGVVITPPNSPSLSTEYLWVELVLRRFNTEWRALGTADGTFLADAAAAAWGAVRQDAQGLLLTSKVASPTPVPTKLTVVSDVPTSQLLVVSSTDALACATAGTIEGRPCEDTQMPAALTLADISGASVAATSNNVRTSLGSVGGLGIYYTTADLWRYASNATLPDGVENVYVLRLRPGTTAGRPGSYEPLATLRNPFFGFPSGLITFEDGYVDATSILPDVERQAGEILVPSRNRCDQPAMTCAGIQFDSRLPLEDELVEDGSEYENSWHVMLQRASSAAELADGLGQEALSTELEVSRMAEDELHEVEQACGVDIPVEAIRAALKGGGADLPTTSLGVAIERISTPGNAYLPGGASPQLRGCLSEAQQVDAAFGEKSLCVWTYHGALCGLAPMATTTLQCPSVQDEASDCVSPFPGDTSYKVKFVDTALALVPYSATTGGSGSTATTSALCNDVRTLRTQIRTHTMTAEEIQAIVARVFQGASFSSQSIQSAAQSIRWEARPGTHASLFLGAVPWRNSGDAASGATSYTYCDGNPATMPLGCTGDNADSLRCAQYDCADPTSRIAFTSRTLRAAYFARYMGQQTISDFMLPDLDDGNVKKTSTVTYPGIGEVRYQPGSGDNGSGSQYCFLSATSAADLWRFPSWSDAASGPPDPYATFNCGGSRGFLRIGNFSTSRGWGHHNLTDSGDRTQAANMVNALRSTDLLDGDSEASALEHLYAQGSGAVAGFAFDPRCDGEHCSGSISDFPWFRASVSENCRNNRSNPMCIAEVSDELRANELTGVRTYGRDPRSVTVEQFFDSVELLCEAADPVNYQDTGMVGEVGSVGQAEAIYERLTVTADAMREQFSRSVIEGLPSDIVASVQNSQGGTPVALQGSYGAQVLRIRGALTRLSTVGPEMAQTVEGMSRALRQLQSQIDVIDAEKRIDRANFVSKISAETAACIKSLSDVGFGFWRSAGASAVCVNSFVQMAAAGTILKNQITIASEQKDQAFIAFEEATAESTRQLRALSVEVQTQVDEVNAALRELALMRSNARRSLSRALFLDSEATQGVFRSNTILRRRQATAWRRYEEARDQALRQTFIAKRAVEQRFGVTLSEMSDELTLVAAPSTWEASLCKLDAIDFSDIPEATAGASDDFSAGYLGDYVRKLQLFVDSYRLDFPFQNGRDTAVISLRDDVQNVRVACPADSRNLLASSDRLDLAPNGSGRGWEPFECALDDDGDPLPNCVEAAAILDADSGPVDFIDRLGDSPLGFVVTAGPPSAGCGSDPLCVCDSGPCGWEQESVLGQEVHLDAGIYRVSWYAAAATVPGSTPATGPDTFVSLERKFAGVYAPLTATVRSGPASSNGWRHYWAVVTVPQTSAGRVVIRAPEAASGGVVRGTKMPIGGLMLEYGGLDASAAARANLEAIGAEPEFQVTNADGYAVRLACEDTTGNKFRAQSWTRHCDRLCPSGFEGNCPVERSTEHCYWETQFTLNERAIERGEMLSRAGFALGSFNYRIESLAVNFVGTASRTCADDNLPSTCYSSGVIPYSIVHAGPYWVRNNFGEDYQAHLFEGVIEHSDGLAAERYLTNPLSSADRSMIDPMMQRQFRGRPLAGTYFLRVWEAPGVNFDGIEDVQILLDYRFWTRFR